MNAIASTLETIVGADGVYLWESIEPSVQHAVTAATVPGSSIACIVYPNTIAELGEVMACAYRNHWRVLPCGATSKLSWGGLADGVQVVISTARLNRLIDHAIGDMTLTAEAGIRFADLQANLSPHRQFLAIDPTYQATATLGGIVATADTGSLRQRYGSVRDMLIGISFVRTDGQSAKAGGQVVKNVAGYDLMKLLTGSYGTLGIITQLTFRLYPIPPAACTVLLTGAREAIAQTAQALLLSSLTPIMADLLPPQTLATIGQRGEMGLVVQFQSSAISIQQQSAELLKTGQIVGLRGNILTATDEAALWQQLRDQIEPDSANRSVFCKIGVLPSHAAVVLEKIAAQVPLLRSASIHIGSGLGTLYFAPDSVDAPTLLAIRQLCAAHQGFLTVLQAPHSLKQALDVWGYSGNALSMMRSLKQQFDPAQILSPCRFVGGL